MVGVVGSRDSGGGGGGGGGGNGGLVWSESEVNCGAAHCGMMGGGVGMIGDGVEMIGGGVGMIGGGMEMIGGGMGGGVEILDHCFVWEGHMKPECWRSTPPFPLHQTAEQVDVCGGDDITLVIYD